MAKLDGKLATLVERIQKMGSEASLFSISEALERADLTRSDVEKFIVADSSSYHRALIARGERFEVYVMTWLPGQASVPHDHERSICAVQVICGRAVETSYSVGPDGYVQVEYETEVAQGAVSAGQDAGVHSIRNPSATETLVTVHVYAPPIGDFRTFVVRPGGEKIQGERRPTVVIVGGGFGGTMTAAQLMKSKTPLDVILIERRGAIGEGVAYGTRDREHLLNVPTSRMSAFPDRPDDFLHWAAARDSSISGYSFLPRKLYSEYLRDRLREEAKSSSSQLRIVYEEARRATRLSGGGWVIHLERGESLSADALVLAIGHRPPSDPLAEIWSGPRDRFVADPWRPFSVRAVPPDEPVAILGAGLTAVDVALSLNSKPRTAPVTLLSRSGLSPQVHASKPFAALDMKAFVDGLLVKGSTTALQLSRAIHRKLKNLVAEGDDWRRGIDGLRPHTARLWNALPIEERRQFLTRLRPFWEVHRHRMASEVANRLEELKQAGLVRFLAGQIRAAEAQEQGVTLSIRPRGEGTLTSLTIGRVVNCTGPSPSNCAESNPIVGSLLVHDLITRDPLSLGLVTSDDGQAITASGAVLPDLRIVGTLRKPQFWESTAVPELRNQAAEAASGVLAFLGKS